MMCLKEFEMVFTAEKKQLKEVEEANIRSHKAVYIIWMVERITLYFLLAYIVIYPVFCLITGYDVGVSTFTGKKSYIIITTNLMLAFSMLSVPFFLWVFRKKLENDFIGNMWCESVELKDDMLFCAYCWEVDPKRKLRNVTVIDLKSVTNLEYDEANKKMTIYAKMRNSKVDINKRKITSANKNHMRESGHILWDYYTPSLYDAIKIYAPANEE